MTAGTRSNKTKDILTPVADVALLSSICVSKSLIATIPCSFSSNRIPGYSTSVQMMHSSALSVDLSLCL